ncbi:MAG: M43 family zinc metalloprotease [Crocinitomicaceae bacterium]
MKQNSLRAACAAALFSMQFGASAQDFQNGIKEIYQDNLVTKSIVGPNGFTRCATMEADAALRAKNPGMGTLQQQEAWLQKKIEEYKMKQAALDGAKAVLLTIPVVVHVIHNGDALGSGENIDDGQVFSQIEVMNQDFRRMLGTNGSNTNPDGADIEVEFCMAAIDPNGLPTNGIDRVQLSAASYSGINGVNAIKPGTIWDPELYMNMWTVDFGNSGLLGYAQFPNNSGLGGMNSNNGAANTDGVVAGYRYFGSQQIYPAGTYSAPYNLGRTMTHEVGHFLGLRHIWGDSNCGNDFCNDTPESSGSNYNCNVQTTCDGIQDMVENYMDYTNDACMNIFTNDQKTRMRTVFDICPRRLGLTTSNVCQLSQDPDDSGVSSIISPTGSSCAEGFTPEVTVQNFGSNTVSSFTINYNIDGGTNQTQAWTGTLATGSSVNVTLPFMASSGTHVFNASTSVPNGNMDPNSGNDASSSNYTLTAGGQVVTFNLSTDCFGEETYWELKDASANLIYSGGNIETVIPPGGLQNGTAQGDAGAYANETTYNFDWCLTLGCYDFVIYDDWGDGLEGTAEPNCNTDGSYSITDQWGQSYVTMQNVAFGGSEASNFCIVVGVEELENDGVNVYPNPSEGLFNVEMKNFTGEDHTVIVTDISGRVVMNKQVSAGTFQLDLSSAAAGSYTMTIQSSISKMVKRIVVNN